MLNLDFDYILLNFLLLWVFVIVGKNISKGKPYWPNAFWAVIAFTFVQGTRYARGNDYMHYSLTFRLQDNESNPLFNIINEILSNIGFNHYSCFMAYAFVFVLCAMFFLKRFREYATWIFPLFLLGYMQFEEYMIRQAFSYSFIFLFMLHLFQIPKLKSLVEKKKHLIFCLLFSFISVSIHTANILVISLMTILYFFVRKPIHFWITIPIYWACVYLLPKIFDFGLLTPILNLIADNNERAASYVSRTDYWFSADGINDMYTRNPIIQLVECIGVSSLLYLGYKYIKQKNELTPMWAVLLNMFFIGISMQSLFRGLEILNRIGRVNGLTWCFVLALVLTYKYGKKTTIEKVI